MDNHDSNHVDRLLLSGGVADVTRQLFYAHDGQTHTLREMEAKLLEFLSARPDQNVSYAALLQGVWGYRASHDRAVIHTTVRRLRRVIGDSARSPQHLFSVRGEGYRFVPLPAPPVPLRVHKEAPRPLQDTTIIGREAELAQLRALMANNRLITVFGPGGCGKTRLARAAMARCAGDFPDGVLFIDLSEARTREGLLFSLGQALGVQLSGDGASAIGDALARRGHALFVFDNVEQIVSEIVPLLAVWLPRLTSGRLVVTSRIEMRCPEEQVLPLSPLPVPTEDTLSLVQASPAVALFWRQARKRRPGFAITEDNAAAVGALVRALDGLPFALELAAARIRTFSPAMMLARLQKRIDVLRSRRHGDVRRHQSLHAVLDWSWNLLDDGLRDVLVQCAVFEGGFSIEAAEEVIALPESGPSGWMVEDYLEVLMEHSLLHLAQPVLDRQRLRMLVTVREVVVERLAVSPERVALALRHARFYADHGYQTLSNDRRKMWALGELDNLLAARPRLLDDPKRLDRLSQMVSRCLIGAGLPHQAHEILGQARDAQPRESAAWGRLRIHQLQIFNDQNAPNDRDAARQVRALAERLGEPALQARAGHLLGRLELSAGHIEESHAHLTAALALAEVHEPHMLTTILADLGRAARMRGRLDDAERYYQRALQIARDEGDQRLEALTLSYLYTICFDRGRIAQALTCAEQSAEIFRTRGQLHLLAAAVTKVGVAYARLGQFDVAERMLTESVQLS
ncbi:MAG: tetratricopeptide repeat protein, partial [Myxococcota bacterium]